MNQEQVAALKQWFEGYVESFYCDDKFINANLKLKKTHSLNTAIEMRHLAKSLKFSASDEYLAEAIGILHDVGRFEQFAVWRTYNDAKSIGHCLLGRKILRDRRVLCGIDQTEMGIIETAVEYHGARHIPSGMKSKRLLFTKLIRDADKIDIYRVAIDGYQRMAKEGDKFNLEIEYSKDRRCSPEIVEVVLAGESVDYSRLKTIDDARLLQIGWIYDINFQPSLERIKERQYLQTLAAMLPQDKKIEEAVNKAIVYSTSSQHSQVKAK